MTDSTPNKPAEVEHGWHHHSWQDEQVYFNADEYFTMLGNQLAGARHSIFVVMYIFNFDIVGRRIISQLVQAQRRGVSVRVLLDGFGSMEDAATVAEVLEAGEVEVKIFNPLLWQLSDNQRLLRKDRWWQQILFSVRRANQRNHAKACIIDDFYLWCGSRNFSSKHLPVTSGGAGWHDYGVCVSGPHVAAVARAFDAVWHQQKFKLSVFRLTYFWNTLSAYSRHKKNRLLVEKISSVQQRLWIVNPYFSPNHRIISALKKACRKGVDCRIIVPLHSDVGFFPLLSSTYYRELLAVGARIFEYTTGILHGKLLIADDFILLGSTNLNHRSLIHDIELDVVLDSDESHRRLSDQFLQDQYDSQEIFRKDVTIFGWRRMLGWFPWLVRYWL